MGTGPFGHSPAGRFNVEIPTNDVLFVDPSPRWIRGERGGETVIDSRRMKMLHQHGMLGRYFFPRDDIRLDLLDGVEPVEPPAGAPGLDGYVAIPWDALDAWYEEDEQNVAHPRDPFHRIDVLPSSRQVRLELDGQLLAVSSRPVLLFETMLPTRYYLPRADVTAELVPSSTRTWCAYKGQASYFSASVGGRLVPDIAWSYPDPEHDATRVRDLIAFFDERIDVVLDGERRARPVTPWSEGS